MAVAALHTAATGLSALNTQLDVIANNLANVNTNGFKASRVNFEDLLYQEKAQPGVMNANGDESPAGIFVGLGTRVANTDPSFVQGSPIDTSQPLDMMIDGNGFFRVERPESPGGYAYTRAGNFFTNGDGEVVLGNRNGPRLADGLTIPDDATSITILRDGTVEISLAGGGTSQSNIQLTTFINSKGLRPIGGNLWEETAASGPATEVEPGQTGAGEIIQGFLEASNADPVTELVEMIKAQRAFEMNSQSIQAADQALQVVANLRR